MCNKDLNRLSAEKIMHYEVGESHFSGGVWVRERPNQEWWLFNPLSSMNQCFMLVAAKLVKDGWGWNIEHTVVHEELKTEIYKDSNPDSIEEMQENSKHYVCEYYENISDISRAFLTAALKAVGAWEE